MSLADQHMPQRTPKGTTAAAAAVVAVVLLGGAALHARPAASDAAAEPAACRTIMGPFLRDLTVDGVTAVFRTDRECSGAVLFRVPGGEDVRLADPAPAVHHEFRLQPLEPDRVYVYRAVVDGREIPGGSFMTPPNPDKPVIIGVYGDTRKYDDMHRLVVASLERRSPDLVIHTGDLVHDGYKQSDWVRFFEIEQDLLRHTPIYPVIGNHDDRGKMGKWWFETLFGKGSGVRSITYGPVHLVILNSEERLASQARWLEQDLRRARRNPRIGYVLAFVHHGPYGTGQFNGKPAVTKYIAPVLRRYGPSIVFSGHEHNYERGEVDGLTFYVTGGGGAVLGRRYCKGKCPAWSKLFVSAYHYMTVEASPKELRVCAYYASNRLLEPCITYQTRAQQEAAAAAAAEGAEAPAPPAAETQASPSGEGARPPQWDQDEEAAWGGGEGDGDDVAPEGYHREGGDWSEPEPEHGAIPSHELPPDAPRAH